MRLVSFAFAFVLALPATAQTPEAKPPECGIQDGSGFVAGSNVPYDELLKKLDSNCPVLPRSPACSVDYSEIIAEQKASDEHLQQMERRGEVVPVLHQYEQEMYYEDRRRKLYEKTCGPRPTTTNTSQMVDMRQKACAALGTVCKPRKHW